MLVSTSAHRIRNVQAKSSSCSGGSDLNPKNPPLSKALQFPQTCSLSCFSIHYISKNENKKKRKVKCLLEENGISSIKSAQMMQIALILQEKKKHETCSNVYRKVLHLSITSKE